MHTQMMMIYNDTTSKLPLQKNPQVYSIVSMNSKQDLRHLISFQFDILFHCKFMPSE